MKYLNVKIGDLPALNYNRHFQRFGTHTTTGLLESLSVNIDGISSRLALTDVTITEIQEITKYSDTNVKDQSLASMSVLKYLTTLTQIKSLENFTFQRSTKCGLQVKVRIKYRKKYMNFDIGSALSSIFKNRYHLFFYLIHHRRYLVTPS